MKEIFKPATSYAELCARFSQWLISNTPDLKLKPSGESIEAVRKEWSKLTLSYVNSLLVKFERSKGISKIYSYLEGDE
jgi:hypothetical protein